MIRSTSNIRSNEQVLTSILKKPSSSFMTRKNRSDRPNRHASFALPYCSPCMTSDRENLPPMSSIKPLKTKKRMNNEPPSTIISLLEASRNKKILRSQQRRLLALYHSANCTSCQKQHSQIQSGGNGKTCDPSNQCTRYSLKMNLLWEHMASCTDSNCSVQHCYSSRSILTHHLRCKDHKCLICLPVRIRFRLNKTKNKENQATPSSSWSTSTFLSRGLQLQFFIIYRKIGISSRSALVLQCFIWSHNIFRADTSVHFLV